VLPVCTRLGFEDYIDIFRKSLGGNRY